jgi:hypothetical protein
MLLDSTACPHATPQPWVLHPSLLPGLLPPHPVIIY